MIAFFGNPPGLKRLPLIPGDASQPHLVGSACKPVLLREEEEEGSRVQDEEPERERGRVGVMEEDGGRERKRFKAGVPFRHSFNSTAGISAIFNWKCHRMSSRKMSLGKD